MVVVAGFPLQWAVNIGLLQGFISASTADEVLFISYPKPSTDELFSFCGSGCCYKFYILFFMVIYGIIMDDFMVYYTQYVNPIFAEKLHKFFFLLFLLIVCTFNTDTTWSFLKLKSLNFPFFLFLSTISFHAEIKDIVSLILLSASVGKGRRSRDIILGASTLVLLVTLVIILA